MDFFNFFFRFKIKIEFSKIERNVTNFGYFFLTKFYITLENFLDKLNKSFITSIFFIQKDIFKNVKKIET